MYIFLKDTSFIRSIGYVLAVALGHQGFSFCVSGVFFLNNLISFWGGVLRCTWAHGHKDVMQHLKMHQCLLEVTLVKRRELRCAF